MTSTARPIGIYYEHPEWFRPLFAELERRGLPYVPLDAARHRYDATNGDGREFGLVFNRMSPSAYLRGRGHSILYTLNYLAHLEHLGVRVVNGLGAFRVETSKALQLSLLKSLGLPFPAGAGHQPSRRGPGGRRGAALPGGGQGQHRRQRRRHRPLRPPEDLARAVAEGRVELGLDQTALVQEYIPARGGTITRVEVLDGQYLYAIAVETGTRFNLCPADICQDDAGDAGGRGIARWRRRSRG